jgi:hypothetical protein
MSLDMMRLVANACHTFILGPIKTLEDTYPFIGLIGFFAIMVLALFVGVYMGAALALLMLRPLISKQDARALLGNDSSPQLKLFHLMVDKLYGPGR